MSGDLRHCCLHNPLRLRIVEVLYLPRQEKMDVQLCVACGCWRTLAKAVLDWNEGWQDAESVKVLGGRSGER